MKAPRPTLTGIWQWIELAVGKIHPLTWLVLLSASLVAFILWMPASARLMIWQGLIDSRIVSGMLLVFGLVAISLVWSVGQRLDVWVFLFFNLRGKRPEWLDRIMLVFTQLGSGTLALLIGAVAFLLGKRLAAYQIILGTLTLWIVVELLKAMVRRSRPIKRVTQARIVGVMESGRSFPSGHTTQAFFLATVIASFNATPWLIFLLYALALVVGVTRMYVGAHYPRDVLAGAILGSIWGLIGLLVSSSVWTGIR